MIENWDRRQFLFVTVGAAAAPLHLARAKASPAVPSGYSDWIVINTLGGFDDSYGRPRAPEGEVRAPISPEGLAAARSSGLTATNVTISVSDSLAAALADVARYDAFVAANSGDLLKVLTTADIRRAKAEKKVGLIYGFQNAAMVEDDAANVDVFADRGVRIIQLTYNGPNQLGGGSLAPGNPGLTEFGREVVERLNARKIVIDLSHSGRQTCLDAIAASRRPISITHTGCAAIANVPRNKTDEELRGVARAGGYIGIYFMPFLAPGGEFGSDEVIAHIEHAIRICGEDNVGIGTDHGITPLGDMQTVRSNYARIVLERRERGISAPGEDPQILPYALDLTGPDQFRTLAAKLSARGYSTTRIEKILGGNFLRYADSIWSA